MNSDPAPFPPSPEPDPVPDPPSSWLPGVDKLMKTHWDQLCARAFRTVRDRDVAADLAQEAIIRYANGPAGYPESTLYKPHLRWLVLSWLRTQKKHPSVPLENALKAIEQITTQGPDALAQLVVSDEVQRIRKVLEQLKAEDAELILRHLRGEPTEQIAAELGLQHGAVRTRIHRAVKRLRALLGADGSP